MSEVPKNHHLKNRDGVYYYRRRVPKQIVPVIGRKMIQVSLKTKDWKKASKLRTLCDLEWDAKFQEAFNSLDLGSLPGDQDSGTSQTEPSITTTLSYDEALRIVREDLEAADAKLKLIEANNTGVTKEELRDSRIENETFVQILEDLSDPEANLMVGTDGHRLLRNHKIELDPSSEDHAQFFELMRRALLEYYGRAAARSRQDHSKPFIDHLFDPNLGIEPQTEEITFGELCDQYFDVFKSDAVSKSVSHKRIDKVGSQIGLIREIIRADTSVSGIDYDRCLEFRATLAMVPKNRTKFYPGVILDEAIKRGKKDNRPLMSYETQSGYIGTFSKILKLAINKKLISEIFIDDIKPSAAKIPNKDKRSAFSNEQIVQFFHSKYYMDCAKDKVRPYENADPAWRFWLPLICMFLGLRLNEACQMHLADVKKTSTGIPYLHVIAVDEDSDKEQEGPEKTLKTAVSERKVPIHPELIRIGLLDYVDKLRKAGGKVLLPGLKPDKYGYYSSYPSKRFNESFLPNALTLSEKQSFHSFRHSFRDAARRIKAPPEFLKAVGAWSQGNLVSDNYGSDAEPEQTLEYVSLIGYPGLDLSHLYVKEE